MNLGVDGAASLYGSFCTNATSESKKVQPSFHPSDASSKWLFFFKKVLFFCTYSWWFRYCRSPGIVWRQIKRNALPHSLKYRYLLSLQGFDSAEMLTDACRPWHICYFNHQSSISARNHKALQIKQQTFLPREPGNCRPYKAEPALPTVCSDKSITSTGMLNIFGRRDRCEAGVEFDQAGSQPSVHYRTSQQEHTLPVSIPQPEEKYYSA